MESCTLKPSLVQGTTSHALMLVKAEVNLTTGATPDPPGTTAALLVITPLCLLFLSFVSSLFFWDYCSPPGNTLPLPVTICYF